MSQSCEHYHAAKNNLLTPNRALFGKGKRSIMFSMQKFGEMCITTYRDNTHWVKLANQGIPAIWVGYAKGHPTGTYWVFNPKTKKIILTRDVTFLHKSFGEFSKDEKPIFVTTSYEGPDNEEKLKTVSIISKNNDNSNVGTVSNSDNDNEKVFDEDIDDKV